jgi:hypothetical protein
MKIKAQFEPGGLPALQVQPSLRVETILAT